MNFNFFDWIRDGVRRSVLLGVSDAVETMGMPPSEESSHKLLHYFQVEENNLEPLPPRRITNSSGTTTRKSPLGRGLK